MFIYLFTLLFTKNNILFILFYFSIKTRVKNNAKTVKKLLNTRVKMVILGQAGTAAVNKVNEAYAKFQLLQQLSGFDYQ